MYEFMYVCMRKQDTMLIATSVHTYNQVQCPNELWQSTGIRRGDEQVRGHFCSYSYEPSGLLESHTYIHTYTSSPIQVYVHAYILSYIHTVYLIMIPPLMSVRIMKSYPRTQLCIHSYIHT